MGFSRRRIVQAAFAVVLALAGSVQPALAQFTPLPSDAKASEPARFQAMVIHLEVNPDGSSTIKSHIELKLLNGAAIGSLAEPAIDYSDSLQDLQIEGAYTL